MNCTTCGVALVPGAQFCPNCGARVPPSPSAGTPTAGLPPAYDEPEKPAPPSENSPATIAPQWVTPGAPGYGSASVPNSTAALVSLIFGILSWVMLPMIGPIVAVVAGHMARREIRASNGQVGGGGMATAGLILGYLQIALGLLAICAIIAIGFLTLLGSRTSP
jgi:hypothetical protein